MNPRFTRSLILALAAMSLADNALAHHSFAMFDHDHQRKFSGTVAEFQWTNPHVYIVIDVPDETGAVARWTLEGASPAILSRIGWKFNTVKAGDEVTVIVGPLRNGEPGALLKQITLPDGRKLGNGGPAGEPNIE